MNRKRNHNERRIAAAVSARKMENDRAQMGAKTDEMENTEAAAKV